MKQETIIEETEVTEETVESEAVSPSPINNNEAKNKTTLPTVDLADFSRRTKQFLGDLTKKTKKLLFANKRPPKTARQISNDRRRGIYPKKESAAFYPKQASATKPYKQRFTLGKLFAKCLTSLAILAILTVTVGGSVALIYINDLLSGAPIIAREDLIPLPSSMVFDDQGELIAELGLEIRRLVSYEDLPQCVIDAFVSIEDSRFFTHHGFDLPRFVKAAMINLKTHDFSQGGSTFTMQMLKNSYFLVEGSGGVSKNIERKIQEIYLSFKVEDIVDKKTILENYLNKNNYVGPYRGIQKAAEYYFDKSIHDVSLAEAALLAGVINLPNYYNPYLNLEAATIRRDEVLEMMVTHGYINEIDCQMAQAIKVEDTLTRSVEKKESLPFQAYVDTVIDEVIRVTGDDPYIVPMSIYTSMNREAQTEIEKIQAGAYKNINVNIQKDIDTATAVVANHTGEIVALGAGKDYNKVQRGFNYATSMKKQPGSCIKPIIDYVLAFEYAGYNTGMIVYDYPINYPDSNVQVWNSNRGYNGPMKIQAAISWSRNVPAVVALRHVEKTVGVATVVKYFNDIGMNWVNVKNYSPQLAIGGSIFATSPLEIAGGYQMLFNYGVWIEPHTVRKIVYYEASRPDYIANPKVNQAVSKQAAWLSASMMRYHVDHRFGTAASWRLKKSYPVYGKTGTTDWGREGARYGLKGKKDKWIVGCTTDYSIVTWAGFDKAGKGHKIKGKTSAYNLPGRITSRMLDVLYKNKAKPKAYKRPAGIVSVTVAKGYYPFVRPFEGSGSTTGLAKKGATVFVPQPEPPEIPKVKKLTATSKAYDTYTISFTKAPKIGNIGDKFDQFGIHWLRQKPNNPANMWGKILYKGTITYEGGQVLEFAAKSNSTTVKLPDGSHGDSSNNLLVCGFYGFQKSDVVSNEFNCITIKANPRPPIPTCGVGMHYDSTTHSCVPD